MPRLATSPVLATCFITTLFLTACNKSSAPPPGTNPQPAAATGSTAPVGPAGNPVAGAPATTAADAPVVAGTTASAPAAVNTAPVTAAGAPAPAPAPALIVPAGTRVTIRTSETLSAEHNDVGQAFTGVLNNAVVVHGATAFPRGTSVRGEITSAKGRGHIKGAGYLGVVLTSIGGHEVTSSEYLQRVKGRGKRSAEFIGGGAGLGALIGGLAGGGKGALIGGLAGAGGGTAAGAYTGHRDVVIPAESAISFTTRSSIRVR